jgi:hypothetical protein
MNAVQLHDFRRVGPQLAKNPGAQYERDDERFYIKGSLASTKPLDPFAKDRAINEVLAAKLMKAAGAGAADIELIDGLPPEMGGPFGIASRFVYGDPVLPVSGDVLAAVQADFAIHAWLANHDVIGQSLANTMIVDGKAINIDAGGALLFRARGEQKYPDLPFGMMPAEATEWSTMRDPTMNRITAWFYGDMSDEELKTSASKLHNVTGADIDRIVTSCGPGDADARFRLATSLIARRRYILTASTSH